MTNDYHGIENGQCLKDDHIEYPHTKIVNFNNNMSVDVNNQKNEIIVNKTQSNSEENLNVLKLLYTNIDNLANKVDELKSYIELYDSDIVLLTESLPKNQTYKFENVFNINGFNCLEDMNGRGVCVFYKDHLKLEIMTKINEMYHPSLFVSIKNQKNTLHLGLIYRSPNNDPKDNKKLNNQLNFATKKLNNLIIVGDFNHPSIDWEFNSCNKGEDHPDSLFLFEFIKMKTNQLINNTTHHKPNCKPSLIDLILTKNPDIISNIKHNPPIGKSHHDTITANISFITNQKIKQKSSKCKNYKT